MISCREYATNIRKIVKEDGLPSCVRFNFGSPEGGEPMYFYVNGGNEYRRRGGNHINRSHPVPKGWERLVEFVFADYPTEDEHGNRLIFMCR